MKSQHEHMKDRWYFECHCGMPHHLLQVELEDEEADPSITFYFISNYYDPWYKRVKNAIKYIFLKQHYGMGDCVAFSERNLEALEEMVGVIKDFKKKQDPNPLSKREISELCRQIESGEIELPTMPKLSIITLPECDNENKMCGNCRGLGVIGTSVGSNMTRGTTYTCDVCKGTGEKE